jgi:hypothetical protein
MMRGSAGGGAVGHTTPPGANPTPRRTPRFPPPRWALVALSQIWERPRCNLVVASAEPSNCSKRQKKSKPAAVLNSNEVRAVGLRTVDHHTVVLASHARGRSASIVDLYSRDFERAAAINDAIGAQSGARRGPARLPCSMLKQCASMIASVQPSRQEASNSRVRRRVAGGTRLRAPWRRLPVCLPERDARVELD